MLTVLAPTDAQLAYIAGLVQAEGEAVLERLFGVPGGR